VPTGLAVVRRDVRYRQQEPVVPHGVIRWQAGLPQQRDAPWFLRTDRRRRAVARTTRYGKRRTVEEWFRDDQSQRNGFGRRHPQSTKPDRLDRLFLLWALASGRLGGIGQLARQRSRPGRWCRSNREKECSELTIGRILGPRREASPPAAFAADVAAIGEAAPNWG
jgi:hypothetical protein